jgi:serine/threonine-protein kinase
LVVALAVPFVVERLGPVEVPALLLTNVDQARLTSMQRDLNVLVHEEVTSALAPTGQVVHQDPSPGLRVPRGSIVRVTVSRGAEGTTVRVPEPPPVAAAPAAPPAPAIASAPAPVPVPVPKLTGRSEGEARRLVHEAGLTVGRVTTTTSEDHPFGVVLRQAPEPAERVPRGTEVSMVINAEAW